MAPKDGKHHLIKGALLIDGELLGDKILGIKSGMELTIHHHDCSPDRRSWRGFKLEFPLGSDTEAQGFGQCHEGKIGVLGVYGRHDSLTVI